MSPLIRHILIPAIALLLFFAVAVTPVEVLGCRTRGLLAIVIAFSSVLAGLGAAVKAARGKMRGDRYSYWWALSALILAIPAVALIILA